MLERLLGASFHAGGEQGREHSLVRQAELGEGAKGPWRDPARFFPTKMSLGFEPIMGWKR